MKSYVELCMAGIKNSKLKFVEHFQNQIEYYYKIHFLVVGKSTTSHKCLLGRNFIENDTIK